ncbi:hypothetical protein ACFL5C_03390, partial [Candidatus Omnitrophota bacterium]
FTSQVGGWFRRSEGNVLPWLPLVVVGVFMAAVMGYDLIRRGDLTAVQIGLGAAALVAAAVLAVRARGEKKAIGKVIGIVGMSSEELEEKGIKGTMGNVRFIATPGTGDEAKEDNLKEIVEECRKNNVLWSAQIDAREIGEYNLWAALNPIIRKFEEEETARYVGDNGGVIKTLTSRDIKNIENIDKTLRMVAEIQLPTIMPEIHNLSLFNISITKRAKRDMGLSGLADDDLAGSYIEEDERNKYVEITVGSLGEAKMQAEALRERNPRNLKLKIRVELAEDQATDEELARLRENSQNILKDMEIDDIPGLAELVISRPRSDSDRSSDIEGALAIHANHSVAIVDMIRDNRAPRQIPEGVVFMEYNGLATADIFDTTLRLMAYDGDLSELEIEGLEIDKKKGWFVFLREIEPLEMEAIKDEFERYRREILTRA